MTSKLFFGSAFAALGFGLLGSQTANSQTPQVNYVTTPTRSEVAAQTQGRGSFYDYASLSMGAKVVAVSHADSLASAQYILDGTGKTPLTFDPADPNPTVVIDLGTRRQVDRVSCAFEAPAGQLDFYLVDNAYSKDDTQAVNLSYVTPPGIAPVANAETLNYNAEQITSTHKPAGSVATKGDSGVQRATVDLSGRQGRFLVAAFHRSGGRRSGDYKDSDFKDFKDKNVAIADNPVKVEGISAFGEPPGSPAVPLVPPDTAIARHPVSP